MKLTHNARRASMLVPGTFALALAAACSDDVVDRVKASDGDPVAETSPVIERREVTLSVPDMSCPMCPITVRKALAGVDGVHEAHASLEGKQARVLFDPARTDIDALLAAVAEAGFSATAQEKIDE